MSTPSPVIKEDLSLEVERVEKTIAGDDDEKVGKIVIPYGSSPIHVDTSFEPTNQ